MHLYIYISLAHLGLGRFWTLHQHQEAAHLLASCRKLNSQQLRLINIKMHASSIHLHDPDLLLHM